MAWLDDVYPTLESVLKKGGDDEDIDAIFGMAGPGSQTLSDRSKYNPFRIMKVYDVEGGYVLRVRYLDHVELRQLHKMSELLYLKTKLGPRLFRGKELLSTIKGQVQPTDSYLAISFQSGGIFGSPKGLGGMSEVKDPDPSDYVNEVLSALEGEIVVCVEVIRAGGIKFELIDCREWMFQRSSNEERDIVVRDPGDSEVLRKRVMTPFLEYCERHPGPYQNVTVSGFMEHEEVTRVRNLLPFVWCTGFCYLTSPMQVPMTVPISRMGEFREILSAEGYY
jgi:hypothetical protein